MGVEGLRNTAGRLFQPLILHSGTTKSVLQNLEGAFAINTQPFWYLNKSVFFHGVIKLS